MFTVTAKSNDIKRYVFFLMLQRARRFKQMGVDPHTIRTHLKGMSSATSAIILHEWEAK